MSPIPRIVSVSLAWAAAIGLMVPIGLAPPAMAAPCSGDAANAPPPPSAIVTDPGATALGPVRPGHGPIPTGRKPRGANDRAPLPKLGPLISALLNPGARNAAPLQQQALVPRANPGPNPAPNPPATGPQPPNATQLTPNPAPAPDPAPAAAPDPGATLAGATTSLAEWVTGPDSPNKTLERFGISGTDLGIPWDNGDPANRQVLMIFGDTFGYCAVDGHQWRYNTLFRSQDRDLGNGVHVTSGDASNRYSGSPVRQPGFSKQLINSIKWARDETGIIPTAGIAVGKTQYVNFMSIRNWGRDGEWTTNYSGIAVSKDNGQTWGVSRAPSARPDRTAAEKPGSFREMRTSRWGRTSSPTTVTSTRSGPRPGEAVRHIWHEFRSALCPTSPSTSTGTATRTPGFQTSRTRQHPLFRARWAKCPSNTTPTSSNTWRSTPTV
ncbi:predicted protein [Mycobacterium tuberculosis T85]|nr:predicted protein [Mycobacterium tuberculosis T85]